MTAASRESSGRLEFTIREPWINALDDEWSSSNFFDGSRVDASGALKVLRRILVQGDMWCRLESESIAFHCSDDEWVYVGIDGPIPIGIDPFGTVIDQVEFSPYSLDLSTSPVPEPADDAYWERVAALVEAEGEAIVLCAWAAGRLGEDWYLVTSAADLNDARQRLVPRSTIATFSSSNFTTVVGRGRSVLWDLTRGSSSLGRVRILVKAGRDIQLGAVVVVDEDPLVRRWRSLTRPLFVLVFPLETSDLLLAAVPDQDGVVRTRVTFD